MATADLVIVGAGTAGCVLAARLSEDPSRTVVLLEAGPDFADLPTALTTGNGEGFDWGLSAIVTGGRRAALPKGKVVGGSAQINGRGAVRALPADYDAWAAKGFPAWSWEKVLPAYCRAESDKDFPGSTYHGANGPVPIVRPDPARLTPPMAGFLDAAMDFGHPYQDDMNAPGAVGIGPYPHNQYPDGARASTASTYLAPARARDNLTVHADIHVDRIVIRDGRVRGVEVAGETITAREVVLACGSPQTPLLLLRSGVDLPGVGRDLYDQPGAVVPAIPVPGAVTERSPLTELFGRLAGIPGHTNDQGFYLTLFTGPPPGGTEPSIALMVGDLNPVSRGGVTLDGIDLGFYRADGDLARMRAAYRHAWELCAHPALARHIAGFAMIDDEVVGDDERLDDALRAMTFSRCAVLGGAAMGAVVDQECRVLGVDGLRVVDLSIVPVPLRAPTALDAIAIAEHAVTLM
ncbi:GMC family oxidoreductase N-terminal domain-containing protein [Allokutzneria sp. A3M-2-11 16]|uniref:GMC family oxidoreductase n=1 Tax=Allokutzneria sp. A3M-2-11 16 TaxID=2962043 RepID=UPI0020B6A512|nr:GMC family oxidoreductase N-terminal domain-containing protein [Allokutzneria sp. A3M-2-11 16]MCP3805103.1 GMC family oxidoreductase N-terminal domain-containing protein [Allokutzneria sp. A3M-2-11 16]